MKQRAWKPLDDHPEGVREAPEARARHFNPKSTLPERARQAWQILVGMAMSRQTVTYARLSELMYGKPRPNILADILGHIASYCSIHDLPALTVIVVSKEGGRPRADALAGPGGVDAERERVYRHDWYDTVPPDAAALKAAFAGPGAVGD